MGIWRPFYIPQQPYNQNFLFFFSKKSVIQEEEENSEFFMRSMLLLLFQMEQFWTTRRTNQNDTFLTLSIYIYWMVLFRTVVVFLFVSDIHVPPHTLAFFIFSILSKILISGLMKWNKHWILSMKIFSWSISTAKTTTTTDSYDVPKQKRKPHHQRHHIRVNDPR